jgi:hypothetical protein
VSFKNNTEVMIDNFLCIQFLYGGTKLPLSHVSIIQFKYITIANTLTSFINFNFDIL